MRYNKKSDVNTIFLFLCKKLQERNPLKAVIALDLVHRITNMEYALN